MRRSSMGLAAAFALALLLPRPAWSADEVTVVMAAATMLNAPPLVAKQLGFFEQEDIDAEIVTTGSGSRAMAAVIGGDAQIYVGPPASVFRVRTKAIDMVVFGAVMTQFGGSFVTSGSWAKQHGIAEDSPYPEKLKALKGARVAVTAAGSAGDQMTRFLAREAGLDPDQDMSIGALGTADAMTAALSEGNIDIFVHGPTAAESAIRNHGAVMYLNTSRGEVPGLSGFFHVGLIARDAWLKKSGDLPVRVLRAVQKALDVMHDPEQTAQARDSVHAAYEADIDKDLYDLVWAATLQAFPRSVAVEPAMIDGLLAFINQYEQEPLDMKRARKGWTGTYATQALAERPAR
jgi:NitT/TauT family transport system substrate-binding protein